MSGGNQYDPIRNYRDDRNPPWAPAYDAVYNFGTAAGGVVDTTIKAVEGRSPAGAAVAKSVRIVFEKKLPVFQDNRPKK